VAFLKKANAMVVHPRISGRGWGGIRKVASAGSSRNLTDQAKEILGQPLHSDTHLVTHCTIVASVDTDFLPNAKLGHIKVGSKTINRKWADYLIKPQCSQFVNNNGDSWSREVLRMAYPTFIGAHNFQEHVQIEEQSKGRIIDAVARDIGDSLYIDILVATDRKHGVLVQDIESGKMATLSMGCTTDFTICTKCGHYAVDETELCDHIKYAKLNTFMDDSGQKRVIAELCGHQTYDENPDAPGGVRFIEASWVAVPAFPGAVMRNVLSPGEVSDEQVRKVLASPPPQWSESAIAKAAKIQVPSSSYRKALFDEEDDEEGEEGAPEAPSKPFQDVEDEVYEALKKRVKERIRSDLAGTEEPGAVMEPNDNIIREASNRNLYLKSLETITRVASSKQHFVDGLKRTNETFGIIVPDRLYRIASRLGPIHNHSSAREYQKSCLGLSPTITPAELRVVVRLGTLLSRWDSNNNPNRTN
jgi:hypothetical protein